MYLYPYKIFALSKNKRLFNANEPNRTIGIYDVNKMSYNDADSYANRLDCKVSILLGEVVNGIKLICLDLDDCFNSDGTIEKETKEFLKEFDEDEYEVSSSGEGLHIYVLTKMDLETFIVKEMDGCKSFECYTNKRHIVTTTFDFNETDLKVGKHDEFIKKLYDKVQSKRESTLVQDIKTVFKGDVYKTEQEFNGKIYKRTPVTDMYTLRGLGFKDPAIIEVIDMNPDAVDQSAHDAKLIRKLMYYTLSFDSAVELAMKTNYFKAKDLKHKQKWQSKAYLERTRNFLMRT
jgi:primase-polymerase (primpol)-like protein